MAKARWHPVSEKLPKRTENMTVTVELSDRRIVTMAYYDKEHSCWRYASTGLPANVVAWMGLVPWEG